MHKLICPNLYKTCTMCKGSIFVGPYTKRIRGFICDSCTKEAVIANTVSVQEGG